MRVHERARAVVFPSFGAYVGGDIVAGLLASGMDRDSRMRLFVDIGTNCELVLGNSDRLLATAAPAGPAFEGAAIRCGMRAAPGAIEVVKMTPDELELGVIGDVEPQGLCGSGLVDAVAELVELRLLDASGRFVPDEEAAAARARHRREAHPARQGAGLRPPLARRGGRRRALDLPVTARRPRAAVRQGRDRDRLAHPPRGGRAQGRGRPAGAARRVLRQLPLARERDPARTRAQAAGAAGRERRQRGRRGGEDGAAQRERARRRHGVARGGGVCRALRPWRLQRPVRRPARPSPSERAAPARWR